MENEGFGQRIVEPGAAKASKIHCKRRFDPEAAITQSGWTSASAAIRAQSCDGTVWW